MAYDSLEALSRAYPGISPEEILTFEVEYEVPDHTG